MTYDDWLIEAHIARLGPDPAARLLRELWDRLQAQGKPGHVPDMSEVSEETPMTELLEDLAEDARRITGIDGKAKRPALPKPNFGPGVAK